MSRQFGCGFVALSWCGSAAERGSRKTLSPRSAGCLESGIEQAIYSLRRDERAVSGAPQNAVESIFERAGRIISSCTAAPSDIAVGPDKNGAIGLDSVDLPPSPLGIGEFPAFADRMRYQLGPVWRAEARSGLHPCAAFRSSQQHETGAEQIDRRYALAVTFEPDMRRPTTRSCRRHVLRNRIGDRRRQRPVRDHRARLIRRAENQPLLV